ncbi:MAG: hypothetical protein KDD50_03075 [Bdellovibrionales bacterium]|nr:hypothetical protein [Bdellovibrionales bacterium]
MKSNLIILMTLLGLPFFASTGFAEPTIKYNAQGMMTWTKFQTFENVLSTTPYTKTEVDLPVLELSIEYYLDPHSEIEIEVEFEHGGTGSTLEYDPFEEFGEFETEQEAGGEVVLSEFYYRKKLNGLRWLKIGKLPLPVSLGNFQESFFNYNSVYGSSGEQYMLPTDWHEIGVEYHQLFGSYGFKLLIVNGLNSEFFRKYNWIGGGYQKRFETINSDDLAGVMTLEYGDLLTGNGIALALYSGDTRGNRYKQNKLSESAHVQLVSLLASWTFGHVGLRAQSITGTLTNSDKVSLANSSLASSVNPGAFASLGHKAFLNSIELSYNTLQDDDQTLQAFVAFDQVDTMAEVEGAILKDDGYNRLISSFGMRWRWDEIMFLKLQQSKFSNALDGVPDTQSTTLAFGFDLAGLNL